MGGIGADKRSLGVGRGAYNISMITPIIFSEHPTFVCKIRLTHLSPTNFQDLNCDLEIKHSQSN